MPFNISKTLISKLPKDEQGTPESVGQQLYDKCGGLCSLCEGEMNLAAEVVEADHEVPEAEGGETKLANLALAHQDCNRTKRDLSNEQVRPYLKFRRFVRDHGGRIKYGKAAQCWGIEQGPTQVEIDGDTLTCKYVNNTTGGARIHSETVAGKQMRYAFIEVPQEGIMNDEEVQPRIIRHGHAFLIYNDLLRNPLHEPPSCRLGPEGKDGLRPLLMFDGQHKTVATWMRGRTTVVVKLYLDMDQQEANFLVNSIQAKIKKLPLSPFELSAKMTDESRADVDRYEAEMAATDQEASEAGFIKWMPAGQERRRATDALKQALISQVLDDTDFRLKDHVTLKGADEEATGLTESMAKTKVITRMRSVKPLSEPFAESTERRIQEAENIAWMVNQVVDQLVEPDEETGDLTATQQEVKRRLFKQGSLQYIADLLAQVYVQIMIKVDDPMLDGLPNDKERDQLEKAIANICSHPVWRAELDRDDKMQAVKLALEKNQNVKEAFTGVALTLSYAVVGPQNEQYKKIWK